MGLVLPSLARDARNPGPSLSSRVVFFVASSAGLVGAVLWLSIWALLGVSWAPVMAAVCVTILARALVWNPWVSAS